MAEKYYSILTNRGKELEAQSSATGQPVIIKDFVVGDGNGQAVTPDPARTSLVKEVYRGAISALKVSPEQANQWMAHIVLPSDVGGFTVREAGLLTDAGELYAIANCAAIEKPESGVSVSLQFRLAVNETASIELKVATGDGLFLRQDANLSDVIDKALARANLELGSAARNNTGDFISSGGGNYPAYLRMTGIETLPTEPAAANLSSLYSAPAPIPANVIVSGGVSNWYNYQAMWGLKRDASNGIQGWAVQINGLDKFKVDLSGNAYANNQKLATEAYAKNYADTTFVPLTRKVNNKALNYDISLSAADVGAISSQGGNYPAYLRMTGIETLPTEPSAANLSALYSAPSPIQPGSIAAGGVANWYNYQAMWGLIRNASTGITGWGVQINGAMRFTVGPDGSLYSNSDKVATESFVLQNFVQDVRLGSETTAPVSTHNPGFVLTAFDAVGGGASVLYWRPVQKLINNQWVTVVGI